MEVKLFLMEMLKDFLEMGCMMVKLSLMGVVKKVLDIVSGGTIVIQGSVDGDAGVSMSNGDLMISGTVRGDIGIFA